MDKLSALLFLGIIGLLAASSVMIYDVWVSPEILICNDDTSITNVSKKKLWLRVKAEVADGKSSDIYMPKSESIEDGCWLPDNQGWYYYSMPLEFDQSTEAFAKGTFTLRIEAIDDAWLPNSAGCGMEAFDLFKRVYKPPEILHL